MQSPCPRCLSSMFPRVGSACTFCKDAEVTKRTLAYTTGASVMHAVGVNVDFEKPTQREKDQSRRDATFGG